MGLKIFDPHNLIQPTYEKLWNLIDYCNENQVDRLDNTEYLEKIENKVNNYVHPYVICDDWFQYAHAVCYVFSAYIYFFENY